MKKVFLITIILSLQLKAELSVENQVGGVDKGHQHQLICKAVTENQEYELNVKWTNKFQMHNPLGRTLHIDQGMYYEIKNVGTGEVWTRNYWNSFYNHVSIYDSTYNLKLNGSFNMHKRIGRASETSELHFEKQNTKFNLLSIKISGLETFDTSGYCDVPVSKLCGSEPINNEKVILDLVFEESSCEYRNF